MRGGLSSENRKCDNETESGKFSHRLTGIALYKLIGKTRVLIPIQDNLTNLTILHQYGFVVFQNHADY
jgi:hypothetical protein